MSTQAQINANRQNAQKSTGPRTDAGKAAVSGNAIRHGLCAGFPLMHDENQAESEQLLEQLRDDNQPVGATEEILVLKMAEHMWNMRRAGLLMTEDMDDSDFGGDIQKSFPLLQRYYTASDRGFNQNLRLLRQIQKERKQQENRDLQKIGFDSQKPVAAPAEEVKMPETPPAPAPHGPAPAPLPAAILAALVAEMPKATGKEPFTPITRPPQAA